MYYVSGNVWLGYIGVIVQLVVGEQLYVQWDVCSQCIGYIVEAVLYGGICMRESQYVSWSGGIKMIR